MSTSDLRLSEQLRVNLAVNGHIHFCAPRPQAVDLITAIETIERGPQAMATLRANYDAALDRIERAYRQSLRLILTTCALLMAVAPLIL